MENEMTPIPHEKVTPGWWWFGYRDKMDVRSFWNPEFYDQTDFYAPIPSVEVCRWLHDAGIDTVKQLEELKRGN